MQSRRLPVSLLLTGSSVFVKDKVIIVFFFGINVKKVIIVLTMIEN